MKKTILAIAVMLIIASCGGSSTEQKPVEATYGPVGVDSSTILPPLADSAKQIDTVNGNAIIKPVE